MTDRHGGYLITLARDIREDDARHLMTAIRQLRGVLAVTPVPADPGAFIIELRRDTAWKVALQELAGDGPTAPGAEKPRHS